MANIHDITRNAFMLRGPLAKKGYDPAMGARPLRRLMRAKVEDALAQEMLFGQLKKGGCAHRAGRRCTTEQHT